jgi:hypothetical protein
MRMKRKTCQECCCSRYLPEDVIYAVRKIAWVFLSSFLKRESSMLSMPNSLMILRTGMNGP